MDVNGKPLNAEKTVIAWDAENKKWIGDVPDKPLAAHGRRKGKYPFIMHTEGHGQLYGPGRVDGPLARALRARRDSRHGQPAVLKQMHNPCMKIAKSDMDKLAAPGDPKYPIVLTTYSLTEHWCGGGDTRNTPALLEAEPQLYVEMSEELAAERGISNGDPVVVESIRGKVEAIAMVTMRIAPFTIHGKTVHLIGMPFCFGWTTPGVGDSTNRLTPGWRPEHHHLRIQGLPGEHPEGGQGHGTGQVTEGSGRRSAASPHRRGDHEMPKTFFIDTSRCTACRSPGGLQGMEGSQDRAQRFSAARTRTRPTSPTTTSSCPLQREEDRRQGELAVLPGPVPPLPDAALQDDRRRD